MSYWGRPVTVHILIGSILQTMKRLSCNQERKIVLNFIYYRLVTFNSVNTNDTNQAYWTKKAFRIQIQVHTKREMHKVRGLYYSLTKTLLKPSRLHTIDMFLI